MQFIMLIFVLGIWTLHADKVVGNNANFPDNPLAAIRSSGDPILQTPARKLTVDEIQNDPVTKQAMDLGHRALSEFRSQNGFGRAIAAPQFGYSISMICLFIHGQKMTIFNPEIIQKSTETFLMWDDCLSFPDKMACVRRHKSISVAFMDDKGAGRTWINLPKDLSELLQHEIDHLNGVLALDLAVEPPGMQVCSDEEVGDGKGALCTVPKIVPRSIYEKQRKKFDSYLQQ